MNDFISVLEGTDDPKVLLRAARWAIINRMEGADARGVVSLACEVHGPETVYMDGEIYSMELR